MRRLHHLLRIAPLILVVALVWAPMAMAAGPTVTVAVSGDAVPGATVTAKATITITDGSTLQSILWKQTGGVPVTLAYANTDNVQIQLPDRNTFKTALLETLSELPLADSLFPSYVPKPAKYEGLQERFGIVGISAHAVNDTGAIPFDLTIVTTSGTYHATTSVAVAVPWQIATGIRNVPLNVPVLMHGKTQATYDWKLTPPANSKATLIDATKQNPEFTPDVTGNYVLTATDLATNKQFNITLRAGTWRGIITGQDANGRPTVDALCTTCHVKNTPNFDMFTPWSKSGHAEIFTQNVNTANGHYGPSCLGCHTVGYNSKPITNNGIDEASDFTQFLASGFMSHGDPLNWTKILTQFPLTARFANIQCENCHGPQDSVAHMQNDGSRVSLSSDMCGTCHGEPPRHGRFQQWQLSGHGNFEVAISEGTDATCAKCHSAQGFLQWQDKNFSDANLTVNWTADEVQPQTCQTCHDPHDIGTTSSDANTNAKVRVTGKTSALLSGFTATDVGSGALCMTCHNGRRGLRNDSNFAVSDATRAPHEGPQADILMGQNLYLTTVGTRGNHSFVQDTCVTCHMESTSAPAGVSLPGVGTNHTFYASNQICSKCHSNITADSVQKPVIAKLDAIKGELETAIANVMRTQIRAGNSINLNNVKTIKSANDIKSVEFISSHGRQGVAVTLSNGTVVPDLSLQSVKVVRPGGASVEIYSLTDPVVAKAGWNYFMVEADKSKGVHNPAFVNSALDTSLFGLKLINQNFNNPNQGGSNAAIGGGIGNGQGAVSCTSPFVYWAEIVGHAPGMNNSQWRTDLVTRNLGSTSATLRFVFHQPSGNIEGNGLVTGGGQKSFEDIVGLLGATNAIGSLEICSDQPLLVAGRTFNANGDGTFGQNFEGYVADLGYGAGQTVSLIGMRQKSDGYRTNLSVTNGGTTEAQVAISLYDATGKVLTSYNLTIPAGQVLQDNEPFRNRATAPDVDWGFATVTVLKGTNIRTSASLIDNKTNDPSTIPAKQ